MNNNIKSLILLIALFAIIMITNSCSTTTLISCDKYIGPEKDECVKNMKRKQNRIFIMKERNLGRF